MPAKTAAAPAIATRESQSSIADRIAALERELAELRQLQRAELLAIIASVIGAGVAFSARELFEHRVVSPALAAALDELGIVDARRLGKKLKALGLARVDQDEHGAVWVCPESVSTLP